MLIKRLILVFFIVQFAVFTFASEPVFCATQNLKDTSETIQKLKNEINGFYHSKHQKQLHALLMGHIFALNGENQNQNSKEEIAFYYLKTLLNLGLVKEARQFVDSIGIQWFENKQNGNWKLNFWGALCDFLVDKPDIALANFDLSIQMLIEEGNYSEQNLSQVYFYKALTLQANNNRKDALPLYLEVLRINADDVFIKRESNRRISSTYTLQKKHDLALHYINQAILLVVHDFSFASAFDIPPFESVADLDAFTDLLQSRAYTFREMAKGNPDSLRLLTLSLRDAEASVITFEKHKRSLVFESDLIYNNNNRPNIYSKTIEAIARMYEVTHQDSLLLKALKYAEMDKVSALLYSIQRNKALYHSDVPGERIREMEKLLKLLSVVEAKRYESQANVRLNDTALFALNMELYHLVNAISDKEKELEVNYPNYRKTKYQIEVPDLEKMLDLSYQKAIVEYVVSMEKLYTFLLINGKLYFSHEYFGYEFIPAIEQMQQMISNGHQIQFTLEEQNEFVLISNKLYQKLVLPHKELIKDKPMLIIPDGQLSLIPFEALITLEDQPSKLDYTSLPYLVKTNDISYAYSLTLAHQQSKFASKPLENKIFAMAPGYERLAGNPGNQYLSLRDARDNLGLLEGAEKEVKMVGKKLSGEILLDKRASEAAFKEAAGNYSVLHLAMHTLVNNEEPLYSKLVFTPDVDKVEDGLLNTYELSEMNLGADMVVLSACNTGFGKLNSGEGIVGLSRGFFQAGCKSLLATLWSVSDKTSLQIMDRFYVGMEQKMPKSKSLSLSKREYLESSKGMLAHPFFWAGFIAIGDDSPIDIQPSRNWQSIAVISTILILLLLFLAWRYKRKKPEIIPAFSQTKQTGT